MMAGDEPFDPFRSSRSVTMITVAGGFCELQINGGFGHDFAADPSSIWAVGERLVEHGVTQFLPTLVSSGFGLVDQALESLAAGPPSGWVGAEPIGWHLEGPWLNPERAGAHPVGALRSATDDGRLSRENGVRLVTLAPEVPGALPLIGLLAGRGVVVSCGHSAASPEQAEAAFAAGATMLTHVFNAMGGLHHREPGLAAVGLLASTPRPIWLGLIADGHHVDPLMVRLAHRLAGDRIVLVSDAVHLLGLTDRSVARLDDGTLAGATVGLARCVSNHAAFAGCSLDESALAASSRPRAVLGIPTPADHRTELDDGGAVLRTIIGGEVVFERSDVDRGPLG